MQTPLRTRQCISSLQATNTGDSSNYYDDILSITGQWIYFKNNMMSLMKLVRIPLQDTESRMKLQ